MEKTGLNAYYLAALVCLCVLVLAGSYLLYYADHPAEDRHRNLSALCSPGDAALRTPVPSDTSVPIQDPVPGLRYSLERDDSNRTIELRTGEMFEINLGFAPGLAMRWTVPLSGCGLDLVNDGNWYTGGDFWNNTGFYRARYRAVSPGVAILHGKLVFPGEDGPGDPRFNLTVLVR